MTQFDTERQFLLFFPLIFTKPCFFEVLPCHLESLLLTFQNVKNSPVFGDRMRPKNDLQTHTFNSKRQYPIGRNNLYIDKTLEFGKSCEDFSGNHRISTLHRSETNGIAGRAVRRVKEGTSGVLLQSGLNESWWADSMECYTYLRNVTDLLSDGKTLSERRFGQPFKGPIIPFGSLVEYHPITAKDQSRIHQFGKKVLFGLFLGYALYAG